MTASLRAYLSGPASKFFIWAYFTVFTIVTLIDWGTELNRIMRLIPNLVALIFLLIALRPSKFKRPIAFLLLLVLSAVFAVFYENSGMREATLATGILAYIALGLIPTADFGRIKTNWFLTIYFVIALLVMWYLLFELTSLTEERLKQESIYLLIMLSNIALIFTLVSALLYVHHDPSKIAMIFLLSTLFLVLSEVLRAASYYSPEKIDLFFYGCRILYVASLTLMLQYCLKKKQLVKVIE